MKVQLFVDDFVRGDLPAVCAVTGQPTNHYTRLESSADASPLWLLLIFLGPVGWGLLLVGALLESRGKTEGLLPILPEVAQQRRRSGMMSIGLFVLVLVGLFFGFFVQAPDWWLPIAPLFAATVVVAVALLIRSLLVAGRFPRAELDGSRRWVTISRVHPAFVAAVELSEREREFNRR